MRPLSVCLALLALVAGPAVAQKDNVPPPRGKMTLVIDPGTHHTGIRKTFWLPDGKIVTLGGDHTVRLWDSETGEQLKVIRLPGSRIPDDPASLRIAEVSDKGDRLAVSVVAHDHDKEGKVTELPRIYVLSLPDGELLHALHGHEKTVTSLSFAPGGKRLASASNEYPESGFRIWNLEDKKPKGKLHVDTKCRVDDVAFAPDNKHVAWVADKQGGIYDLTAKKEVAPLRGHRVVWSPDGKTIATAWQGQLRVYDAANGKLLAGGKQLKADDKPVIWCKSLAFSRDSKTVLWSGSLLLDAAKGTIKRQFGQTTRFGTFEEPLDGDFSPNGKRVVSVGTSEFTWILLREAETGKVLHAIKQRPLFTGGYPYVAPFWSKDGKTFGWRTAKAANDKEHDGPAYRLGAFDMDKLTLAATPKEQDRAAAPILKQDKLSLKRKTDANEVVEGGKVVARVPGSHATFLGKDRVASIDKYTLWGIGVFDAHTGKKQHHLTNHSALSYEPRLCPSPDGRYLLTLQQDQTVAVWHPPQKRPLVTLYKNGRDWVVWTKEGYYDATPGGEKMVGWRVDNGPDRMPDYYPVDRFRKLMHRPDVIKKAFADGTTAAVALKALDGKNARLIDVETSLPPKATVKVEQKGNQVKVKVKAVAGGQKIESLQLMINGRPFTEEKKAVANYKEKPRDSAETEWTVTLPEGTHLIDVQARGMDFSSRSEGVEVRNPGMGKPTLHVLTIGIDRYSGGIAPLKCAVNDAKDLEKAFGREKDGLFGKIDVSPALTDADATVKGITARLAALAGVTKRQDVVVIFFAGHGVKQDGKLYLLTHESKLKGKAVDVQTALSGKELAKHLGQIKGHVLLLLDACHAGAMAGSFRGGSDDVGRNLNEDDFGIIVLAAATGNQVVREEKGNGFFTAAVKDALAGGEGVPRNHRDGRLYVHHLHAHVVDAVDQRSNGNQTPYLHLPPNSGPLALRQFELK